MREIRMAFQIDFPYDSPPSDLVVDLWAEYDRKKPLVTMLWTTPDGREIDLASISMDASTTFYASQDSRLARKLGQQRPQEALFAPVAGKDLDTGDRSALRGTYQLVVSGFVFEDKADVDARLTLYGRVHGLAGTDHRRRDLTVGLLWGMPVALALGVLGAVCSSLATMLIAGIGVWFGGWVDNLIQRLTEIDMTLPAIPLSVAVYFMYSKSVWMVLGIIILLSVFGSAIKNYRAAFLQVKEAAYIEAAQSYGAGDWRIILRYLVPRILPVLIPQLVIMVPGYVFLEATLAIIGVRDPVLPTWGKLIYDSLTNGSFQGYYYWILEPMALLMLTGLAFAMLGFALDRILNPRLREE
jgi:peptide/nickel transport system permease protein